MSGGSESVLIPRLISRASGDILGTFDPDDRDTCVDQWLSKIDQLGHVHGWSSCEKSLHMQVKLRGEAQDWFNRLDNFDRT